jgi:hypothetical protein
MKNNKGYYGWIHSLNQAAMRSQQNGFRMINEANEAKAKKITDPAKRTQLMGQMPQPTVINPESPSAHPADVMDAISRLGPHSPGTINLADGDVGEYVNLQRMKRAERMAQMARSRGPIDAKPAGNAQAVENDGQDLEIADPDLTDFEDEMAQAAEIRRDALANRARREQEDYPEEPEDDYRYTAPTANWQTVRESINSKILRMMNEDKGSKRGHIVKGSDSEIPSKNPNMENAPKGMFRGTESASEKLGKILEIVRDGPEKHGKEAHSWASNALEVMQKQLRKD